MITTEFSGGFQKLLERRLGAWSSHSELEATIVVPPELAWWSFQEYAGEYYPTSYRITGNPLLAFTAEDGFHTVTDAVNWQRHKPGTHTVRTVQEQLPALAKELLGEIFAEGIDDPVLAEELFIEMFMPRVKQMIVDGMEQDLSTTPRTQVANYPKQDGKLEGRLAFEVFDEYAVIVNNANEE